MIRAWERRYGLLAPTRSESNFRLYTSEDVTRRVFAPAVVLRDVVLPYLREVGQWCDQGEQAAIAQQHFATGFWERWMLGSPRVRGAPGNATPCWRAYPANTTPRTDRV